MSTDVILLHNNVNFSSSKIYSYINDNFTKKKNYVEINYPEEWISLASIGFPSYSVSNYGDVRNDKRKYSVVQTPDLAGYRRVCLSHANKKKQNFVHKLVAMFFIGQPKKGESVDHIDRNRTNNCVSNLRWLDPKGQSKNSTRSKDSCGKRPVNQYDMKGKFLATWNSIVEASKATGTNSGSISRSCSNKYNHGGGFLWKYVDEKDIEGEIWKKVHYEDCQPIMASNKGRFIQNNGQKRCGHFKAGYFIVSIKSLKTGKFRDLRAHRVIIAAFQGESELVVNHKDGNKTNNNLENLEYLTQRNNVLHAIKIGLVTNLKPGSRAVIITDKNGVETFHESFLAAGKALKVSRRIVSKMCNRDNYKPSKNVNNVIIDFTCRKA